MSKILLIEDDETMRDGMSQVLKKAGHQVTDVSNGEAGVNLCRKEGFDLVITDQRMKGITGLEVLEQVKAIDEDTDAILITAYGNIDMAVEAMRKGAADFITKPFSSISEFKIKVEKVLEFREARQAKARLDEENRYLREEIDIKYNFGEIVGASENMMGLFEKIEKVLGFKADITVEDGIKEVKDVVVNGVIKEPNSKKYRNFEFIVQ